MVDRSRYAKPQQQKGAADDFPILCRQCLGDSGFVRMQRAAFDAECKMCAKPMAVHRWRPSSGKGGRMRRTEVCQSCARLRNVCQACMLDLEFGLPADVRDAGLARAGVAAAGVTSQQQQLVNREWQQDVADRAGEDAALDSARVEPGSVLRGLARADPSVRVGTAAAAGRGGGGGGVPGVCSLWLQGKCTRGAACPFRHEMIPKKPSSVDHTTTAERK